MIENTFKKRASDFDNVAEILSFIKSEKDINIKVEVYEYWSGYIQLENQPLSKDIQHTNITDVNEDDAVIVKNLNGKQEVEFGEGYETYNLYKKAIESKFYMWGIGNVGIEHFTEMLNDFIDDESSDGDFYEFIEYWVHCQDVDDALEPFEAINIKEGIGEEFGNNDISWSVVQYLNKFKVDIVFY